jgi:PIN domain nuclease of toxin-antitoxin system
LGLLLDTHYAYALAGAPGRLSAREVAFLAAPPAAMFVSAVSIWEMRLKWGALHASGAPKGPISPAQALQILAALPIEFLPLHPAHAAARLAEPLSHDDPFDELLLVQAQLEGHKLLTRDSKLIGHGLAATV